MAINWQTATEAEATAAIIANADRMGRNIDGMTLAALEVRGLLERLPEADEPDDDMSDEEILAICERIGWR